MHHDVTLPSFLIPFMVFNFAYNSIVHESYSGRIYVKNNGEYPIQRFVIKSARISERELSEFHAFCNARKGSLFTFNLHDPADNTIKKVRFETNSFQYNLLKDGSFQLNDIILREVYDV